MRAGADVVDVRTLDPGYHKVRALAVHLVLDAEEAVVDDGSVTAFDVEQTVVRRSERKANAFRQSRRGGEVRLAGHRARREGRTRRDRVP